MKKFLLQFFTWWNGETLGTRLHTWRFGKIVGTFQTTMIVSMNGRGGKKLMIEAVQTRSDMRGQGIGSAMMRFAIEQARATDARLVQLTSNKARADAHRFYERLGFVQTHAGFKMKLG